MSSHSDLLGRICCSGVSANRDVWPDPDSGRMRYPRTAIGADFLPIGSETFGRTAC